MQKSSFRFNSLPNFRTVVESEHFDDEKPKLYRSSRPDLMTPEDFEEFRKLGIRSIIDFRAHGEYERATGTKMLDHYYPRYKVNIPRFGETPLNSVKAVPVESKDITNGSTYQTANGIQKHELGKHYFIDFFKLNYIWMVFNKAPMWFRLYSLIYLVYDIIFKTGFRQWIRAFAKQVLNKDEKGLAGQYLDMIDHSKASIYSALKLLSEPENVPAMINCAHGKDRTGIISALVLTLMGKTKQQIIADYASSKEGLSPVKDRVHFEIVTALNMSPTFTQADEQNMIIMLDYIDSKYGSVQQYLEGIGFTRQDQDQLRRNLRGHD